jgi:hypothetical protein
MSRDEEGSLGCARLSIFLRKGVKVSYRKFESNVNLSKALRASIIVP